MVPLKHVSSSSSQRQLCHEFVDGRLALTDGFVVKRGTIPFCSLRVVTWPFSMGPHLRGPLTYPLYTLYDPRAHISEPFNGGKGPCNYP